MVPPIPLTGASAYYANILWPFSPLVLGWGGGAVKAIEAKLQAAGIRLMEPGFAVKWAPTAEELSACAELGRRIAHHLTA